MEYSAITLDTSIFDRNALKLESGLLGKMSQFSDSDIDFIISDIVEGELLNHLRVKIEKSINDLKSSINEAKDNLFFSGSELNQVTEIFADAELASLTAQKRLHSFLKETGAVIIESSQHMTIAELKDYYFNFKPPFKDAKNKKHEFPDAIALIALESWAKKNSKKIYAISTDGGWKDFCDRSDFIDCYEDLGHALDFFNQEHVAKTFVNHLEGQIKSGSCMSFLSDLSDSFNKHFDGTYADAEADSFHAWESDSVYVTYNDFDFADDKLLIVDKSETDITLEANIEIHLEAEGEFSLSIYDSIDRENVYFGGVTKEVHVSHETRVLIKLQLVENDKEDFDNYTLEEVEILDKLSSIDFGTLELSYDEPYGPDEI
ncbi:PIN domain-containing protein [Pantoea dispersa]|uniref:PIN domain-containing protein n=1 Tax=Pantoea dispersa TaxID=59814 RepID=UPI002865B84C|nr:PIN domain-containing protein [Pantoea dispersa]MDR6297047.1 hypothetical protein [Pantoea dispersa]